MQINSNLKGKNAKIHYGIWMSEKITKINKFYRAVPELNITPELLQSLEQAREGKNLNNF